MQIRCTVTGVYSVCAAGNILENRELVASLEKTKQSGVTIEAALAESAQLQAQLDAERGVYRALGEFGARLYFVLADLVKLNTMYQFSLNEFLGFFQSALASAEVRVDICMNQHCNDQNHDAQLFASVL